MNISRNQHTLASVCEVRGKGYWSGDEVRIVMRPAEKNTGIVLVRSDLPGEPSCPAHVSFRSDAGLRTNLTNGEARFQMVEHLLAALYAFEIDNCRVEINAEELPGLDGSSRPYVSAIQSSGLIIQAAERQRLVIEQLITLHDGAAWITASPAASGVSQFGYQLAFDHPGEIPNQCYSFACTPRRFAHEIAPARTFVTETQAKSLQGRGVAEHVSYQDLLVFGESGPIDNELRFVNECARHKTLDLVGDLSLAGVELIGRFTSHRGGHQLNGRMAKALYELAALSKSAHSNCVFSESRDVA